MEYGPMAKGDNLIDLRKNGKNGADKWASVGAMTKRGDLTWEDADGALLKAALVSATQDGAALLLSKTSDGGALAIQVLHGTSRSKLYPATPEELKEALQLIYQLGVS